MRERKVTAKSLVLAPLMEVENPVHLAGTDWVSGSDLCSSSDTYLELKSSPTNQIVSLVQSTL